MISKREKNRHEIKFRAAWINDGSEMWVIAGEIIAIVLCAKVVAISVFLTDSLNKNIRYSQMF